MCSVHVVMVEQIKLNVKYNLQELLKLKVQCELFRKGEKHRQLE